MSRKPFGFSTFFHGNSEESEKNNIKIYGHKRIEWISDNEISVGRDRIHEFKVLTSKAYAIITGDAHQIIGTPFIIGPGEVCTETYIVMASFKTEAEAVAYLGYVKTKFFRFLVAQKRIGQDINKDKFQFVPCLDMSKEWTDEDLYEYFGLDQSEIDFIESTVKEMP